MNRNALLAGLFLTVAAPAFGQDSPRPNLTGTWTHGSARLVLEARRPGPVDAYVVRDEVGSVVGRAEFDGRTLRLVRQDGVVTRLLGDSDPDATTPAFAYQAGREEALSNSSERFVRTRTATRPRAASHGSRSQIAAAVAAMEDALGNRNGIPGDETTPGLVKRALNALGRNPLARRVMAFWAPGLSTKDEVRRLRDFVASREAGWGRPVTTLSASSIPDLGLFEADKAAALTRIGRTPDEVTEGFITARGSVDGQRIADRRLFWQRWKPKGRPSGRIVVVSPGFQETHRNFREQIQLLNAQGDEVIVMDHQWAGHSDGSPGGLDRGFGVARDVAAVAAFAHQVAPGKRLLLFGNSMGAGPGVLGAVTLNDAGLIHLDGPAMPRGVPAVLQAPFLEMTPGVLNKALAGASHVPLVNRIRMPALGLPPLSKDRVTNAKAANEAVLDDIRAQTRTMRAASADVKRILEVVDEGRGPRGRIHVVHGDQDPLAHVAASRRLVAKLGTRARLHEIASPNHVLEESPTEQGHAIAGVRWVSP